MKKCSLGISNGGTTMLELIYLRKIVFVYPQNEKEEKFANFLRKKKYKIFIKPKKLSAKKIDQILKINQKKKSLIDNLGVNRIFEIITNNFKKGKKIIN